MPNVLHEAGGLASDEMRQWTDNTGNFSCRGRLVRFYEGQVRLLKDNGRTTTVPLARLSTGDLEFVNRQASAQQAEVGKTAHSPAMMPIVGELTAIAETRIDSSRLHCRYDDEGGFFCAIGCDHSTGEEADRTARPFWQSEPGHQISQRNAAIAGKTQSDA